MMNFSTIISNDGTVSCCVSGKVYVADTTHPNYAAIIDALKVSDAEALVKAMDVPKAVASYTAGKAEVRDGEVYYEDKPVHTELSKRIIRMMREGYPFEHMLRFMDNLNQNPSKRAKEELFNFLQHHGLPITEDGHFLAYKRVTADWKDCHTRTTCNTIGTVVKMSRNEVDDNWGVACSQGYHVGAMSYVQDFANHNGNRIVIVKVNPRDAVAVPNTETNKMRVCQYEVMYEYTKDLTEAVYTPEGRSAVASIRAC